MPHLHLSLQHGADLILKRMKRRHLRADAHGARRAARARLRPGHRLRRRPDRRLPDRDRGACSRETLALVEEMRPDLPARLPLLRAPRHAGGAHAAGAGAAAPRTRRPAARGRARPRARASSPARLGRRKRCCSNATTAATRSISPRSAWSAARPRPGELRRLRVPAADADGLLAEVA